MELITFIAGQNWGDFVDDGELWAVPVVVVDVVVGLFLVEFFDGDERRV